MIHCGVSGRYSVRVWLNRDGLQLEPGVCSHPAGRVEQRHPDGLRHGPFHCGGFHHHSQRQWNSQAADPLGPERPGFQHRQWSGFSGGRELRQPCFCGDTAGNAAARAAANYRQPNAPAITLLTPSSALAGGNAFTLQVNGTNFDPAATVQFNGSPRATTFISTTQLQATINLADVASASTSIVTVANPIQWRNLSRFNVFCRHQRGSEFRRLDYQPGRRMTCIRSSAPGLPDFGARSRGRPWKYDLRARSFRQRDFIPVCRQRTQRPCPLRR